MKKIDKLVLGAFLGPFVMTFLVVVFILLTQHMLKYFDDIIGKGLGAEVISQLLFYFGIFMTPVALPLAVLLSSLIAFGNLGEHFELTAIKSAGISLVRALRPIFFFVLLLTGIAFYANNNLVPKAALEAYSLLYDIKQKKPALDLREGSFYNGINDISIKVNKKFPDGITIQDVVVYDHRKADGNKEVTVADSGRMYTILNERYLKFELFDGYRYSEGGSSDRDLAGKGKMSAESMTRTKFSKSQVVFDLSSFQFERTDKKWFEGNRIMRNVDQLSDDLDSLRGEILTQQTNYYGYHPSYFNLYAKNKVIAPMPEELKRHRQLKDSLAAVKYSSTYTSTSESVAREQDSIRQVNDQKALAERQKADSLAALSPSTVAQNTPADAAGNTALKLAPGQKSLPTVKKPKAVKPAKKTIPTKDVKPAARRTVPPKPVLTDSMITAKIDSLFAAPPSKLNVQSAANNARHIKQNILNTNAATENYENEMIIFEIQWHKILASSLACVAMFLIGAPLGAIIKKGGLGMPFLVSIIFFIVYYVITMQGEKLAKQGTVSPAVGVWMADAILFVIGLIFLRQARADARLFEADFYNVVIDKIGRWLKSRTRKAPVSQAG
jgi:lipopolysaccharide export system permease protein